MTRLTGWLLILALTLAGCSNSGESAGQETKGELESTDIPPVEAPAKETVAQANGKDASAPAAPKPQKRATLEGRWLLVVSNNREAVDFPAMLIDIQKNGDDQFTANLLEAQFLPGQPKLQTEKVTKDSLHLVFDVGDDNILNVEGTLDEGAVKGSVAYGTLGCDPIRMLPTAVDSIKDLQPKESPGRQDFAAAVQADDSVTALKEFIKKYPYGPLSVTARARIIILAKSLKFDEAALDQAADEFFKQAAWWGPQMEQKAKLDYAVVLIAQKFFVNKGLDQLDQLEQELPKATLARWKKVIDDERKTAQTNRAIELLGSDAGEDEKKRAAEVLETAHKNDKFNHELLFALASYNEQAGNDDEALKLFAQLSVYPYLEAILQQTWQGEAAENDDETKPENDAKPTLKHPLPSESVAKLWKKKHGSTKGLDEYLDKLYRSLTTSFGDQPVAPRGDGGHRVALLEFFTGAECVPCIAPNVAVDRLENSYAPTELVTLVYHEHTAGPNPLVNEDSEQRQAYYFPEPTQRGTPMALLNGRQIENIGHPFLSHVDDIYKRFRQSIDRVLDDKSEIQIKLQAVAEKGSVRLRAQVDGLKSSSQTIRLRLAIAEKEVTYRGGNGIRHHNMVVRKMPGGQIGLGPEGGKIAYQTTVKMDEVKQQLGDYLAALEQRIQQQFPAKPLEFKDLHLVAYVQDDTTKEVLQAASIPVSGTLEISSN